ncbi:tRNA (N(6)-L-threonylcarbamoyladenosine(37)-C(2))-methylthiotransferase MtaB [Algicella marina]|uniref:tRNA (N(6)-L-threonylcarbamoyladenosine(37)-C(2))-methylthiotransferase MtaB n=1 Tax=Algicella marina TaxID=2683284 RepID=A0A6P1T4G7_9RHOB|nr:tRNA (N(6)-L-threonylcarbamoyladenosine(37)-C(2))-methylthiotransferase MtaB [Algicella marina]QHQ36661.1 tRNA (N(6)-L-threonylcarbamoyladenosine(37)-C(2))-methylthiotransferase MtaB [Algicella marina]
MSAPKFETFGCRLNAYETEAMKELAAGAGLENAVVVNTCAVTTEAVRQSRQRIRRLAKDNPGARIIVTGCAAQTEPETYSAMPEVAHVVGNLEKMRGETWAGLTGADFIGETERVQVDDIMSATETAGHLIDGFGTRARAYVQVQNGCDHRCTFCIIPYGRGNSRSVPAGVVVEQIQRLVERGYHEVVLTGVDLTSWGSDLPAVPKLGDLVQRILKLVPGLARLRISSIDSIEADPALVEAIASESRLMPHLHLSLQAGDDLILKRMKRRHLRDDAIRFCADMRAARPDIVFGADIIAGFPTETEEMFARSLDLVEECGLTWLHVFPYSVRHGTPAAKMPQVDGVAIKERAARLRAAGEARVAAHLAAQVGREAEVLTETPERGRLRDFTEVRFTQPVAEGALVRARLVSMDEGAMLGEAAA